MTKNEALRLALKALELAHPRFGIATEKHKQAITAIKAALEAKDETWEKFCDSHCVWTDHHLDCKLAKDEPVACWCHKCNENELVNGIPFAMTRMILCPNCGNKRCPKASDHTLQCTNSNEPNQAGSVYTAPPQRKPLTDEQIGDEFVRFQVGGMFTPFLYAVRAIEAAHGIKGEA